MQSSFTIEERKIYDEFSKKVNLNKVLDLMKIKGTIEDLVKQVDKLKGIECKKRFYKVIEYFKRLRSTLKMFGVVEMGAD